MPHNDNQIHNNFFTHQFSSLEFALSFFQNYLPKELRRHIDWDKFHLVSSDFVNKALKNRKSDLLYETRIEGRKSFFYLHLEHQSRSDQHMAFRMLSYWFNILDQHRRSYPDQSNPLIFPMVLYQGSSFWSAAEDLHKYLEVPDFMKPYTPQFRYEVMDLSHLSDEEVQGKLLVRVCLLIMKHIDIKSGEELVRKGVLDLLEELLKEKTGLEHIETILYYLFKAGKNLDKEEIVCLIQELPEQPQLQEVMMTLAEQWKQEGEERGIQKGIQKGIQQGESLVVSKQLKLKFQATADPYFDLLDQTSQEELELIAERILTCDKIDAVFEGITKKP